MKGVCVSGPTVCSRCAVITPPVGILAGPSDSQLIMLDISDLVLRIFMIV